MLCTPNELYSQLFYSLSVIKGTPLRSGHVTHLIFFFSKTCFLLLLTCVRHSNLSCGTLKGLLSLGNLF